jgi:hypothetical protein
MLHYAVMPRAAALAAGATLGILRVRSPLAGSIVRVDVTVEDGEENGAGASLFDVNVEGASIFAAPENRLSLAADAGAAFVGGLAVVIARGDLLTIDADSLPAGGFAANSLTLTLTIDDGAYLPTFDLAAPASRQAYLYDPLTQKFKLADPVLTQDSVIADLYYGAFARAPDLSELAAARSALLAGFSTGATAFVQAIRTLGHSLFVSAEYVARSRTNSQFVTDLYHAYLGREPEAGGLADWVAVLTGGATRSDTDLSFSTSLEFQSIRVPRVYGASAAGLPARDTVVKATASIANGAEETGTVALGKTFLLLKIVATQFCRIRLYSTAAARTADAARGFTTEPATDASHQIILDLLLDGITGLTWIISSGGRIGFNADSPAVSNVYYAIQNNSGGNASVSVTFNRISMET